MLVGKILVFPGRHIDSLNITGSARLLDYFQEVRSILEVLVAGIVLGLLGSALEAVAEESGGPLAGLLVPKRLLRMLDYLQMVESC